MSEEALEAKHLRSLDNFFYEKHELDLNTCDLEPIHLTEAIQAEGYLILIDPASHDVLAFSENIGHLLDLAHFERHHYALQATLPDLYLELQTLATPSLSTRHRPLDTVQHTAQGTFHVIYHHTGGYGFLEFLPEGGLDVTTFRRKLRLMREYNTAIIEADSFNEALSLTISAARDLTGFKRVNVYQFEPDGSGAVIAEHCSGTMSAYLGLHFPASDVPKQARYLMRLTPYRAVGNVHDQRSPLRIVKPAAFSGKVDLSYALLRSVSEMHTQYLRNMGVESAFTVTLMHKEQLWGALALHDDTPGLLPFDLWGALEEVSLTLMSKLRQEQEKETAQRLMELRAIDEQIGSLVKTHGTLESSVTAILPELRRFIRGDGIAFRYGNTIHCEGNTPPAEFIEALLSWAATQTPAVRTFATSALHTTFPPAAAHMDTACGVLIEPIHLHRSCHLVWFRKPSNKVVQWAGNPNEKNIQRDSAGQPILQPRHSFAKWISEHNDISLPWLDSELDSAREILKNVLDILANQLDAVSRSKRYLEVFSYAAAHDLRAPLSRIKFAMETLHDPDTTLTAEETQKLLQMTNNASSRLSDVISGITQFLSLDQQELRLAPINTHEHVQTVLDTLQTEINNSGATITVADLPTIQASPELFHIALVNLLTNAIKYRDPARALKIHISATTSVEWIDLIIQDNGTGIPAGKEATAFIPFQRLHPTDQDTPGVGLGLALVNHLMALHKGDVFFVPNQKVGATVTLRFKRLNRSQHQPEHLEELA